ncbi:DUF5658 family protein [Haloarcula amylovorans]|uniref:DUF5658 family protein n=1 Tax=Haloarcula amylovorans TaxID=2562280 RepID=UPI00107635B5|nr:DUF5658 family protein [Halomicroarcula amylolytica]
MTSDLAANVGFVGDTRLRYDHVLWGVVLGASSADVVLTLVGLSLCFSEANPVARAILDIGGGVGLLALKIAALGVLFAVCRRLGTTYRRAALLAFSLPQLYAVGHNGLLLARYAHLCG